MMILKKLCYGLSGSLFLASSLLTISSHAATDSIGLTVTTDIEMGTCTSMLTDDGQLNSLPSISEMYIYLKLMPKLKLKPSNCSSKTVRGFPGKRPK